MPEHPAGEPRPSETSAFVRPAPGTRYQAVDALRGLIMMFMAIDHASGFFARQHSVEFWSGAMSAYTSAFPFLVRLVTHLCAPGFFFLMGAGIYWAYASRSHDARQQNVAVRRTAWRGCIVLLLAQFVEQPLLFLQSTLKPAATSLSQVTAPIPNDGSAPHWALLVLSSLGMAMVVCALMLRWRPWMWLAVAALCVFATNTLLPADGGAAPVWLSVLLVPGLSDHIIVLYPLVPWLAAATAGMYFGHWWRRNPESASRHVWIVGAVLLAAGCMVRFAGGWGNIRPPRDGGWIEFLNNVKYPPSLVFLLMMLGANLLLLAVLHRLPAAWKSSRSPWIVFGQTPLFFYLFHFVLLVPIAHILFEEPSSFEVMLLTWPLFLLLMYPLCLWYRGFKFSRPRDSFWRLM